MKFLNAIDEFMESSPLLPDGASDQLKAIGQHLRGYDQADLSPGQKAVKQATEMAEANFNAVASTATTAAKPAAKKEEKKS
jgi:hypothetical protein